MICIAPDLRRAGDRAGGQAGLQGIEGVSCRGPLAADIRGDVHHVAVTLDGHYVGQVRRSGSGPRGRRRFGQIDQHHVLGTLFGIGAVLRPSGGLHRRWRRAARAGQGADRDPAIDHADHHFGRTAHERYAGRADVEHERAGINHAKSAVDLEGMGPQRHFSRWLRHDLEDVAGADVFDALADRGFELLLGEVGAVGERYFALVRMSNGWSSAEWAESCSTRWSTRRHAA